jgi:hypothetical protein
MTDFQTQQKTDANVDLAEENEQIQEDQDLE